MPGDRGRAGDAGEARFREDARAALEVRGARALDDHEARADARDHDAPDRAAVAGVAFELARRGTRSAPLVGEARERPALERRGRGPFDRAQRAAQMVLAEFRVQSAENGSCQTSVTTASISASAPTSDQRDGERAHSAAGPSRERRAGREQRAGRAGVVKERSATVHLSSQSRLGPAERSRAGVGQRAADRDLEVIARRSTGRRCRSASESMRPRRRSRARGSTGRAPSTPDVAAREEQHAPSRRPRRGRARAGGRRRR